MLEFAKETAVVCHDAGAAAHAFAWIDRGILPGHRVVAEGPAARLWAEHPRGPLSPGLDAALAGAEAVVTGTGWQSDLEHRARARARAAGLRNHAILDHWVNYRARFERGSETILPDELLVADREASDLARAEFPTTPIRQLPNLWLEAELQKVALARLRRAGPAEAVLVLLEPARSNWGRQKDGIFQALNALLAHWEVLGLPTHHRLLLRPHPSDPPGRYSGWMANHPDHKPELSSGRTLAEDLADSAVVAGLQSQAMVVALAAGCDTISILPPWAPPCALPQPGIRHLRNLMAVPA